ncbi:hypothetical protein MVES1_000262 [Malassezia vespertilionis]|uniref:Thioesterase domain-containing protein n=1 Tax=Malassezia vespertilionis TaxID=2020962 RepID=A0A2N1JGN9_9BASI|nr:uncharacterized protein MVES1_000262 [Malassezia vespertilionis]PKI85698.1 hypothetical protein MVES_000249 [Malassezia vespertilionis]WFD04937.1 hypothetical protein MVES1_000262 [Malassezia vespertilionis]
MEGAVLLVFVHGFKGDAKKTFGTFPERLAHILHQTHPQWHIDAVVYPTYATRGAMDRTVTELVAWINSEVDARESSFGRQCMVVLCGHSMGGMIALDAALALQSTPHAVRGVLAFDTPYLGVHPHVFKHRISATYDTALKWGAVLAPLTGGIAARFAARNEEDASRRAAWIGAGTALAAGTAIAAGALFTRNDVLSDAYTWATDHLAFVGNLWDVDTLHARLDESYRRAVPYHCFHTRLAADARTFILPPPPDSAHVPHFTALDAAHARDEIEAHTGMFRESNGAYYSMGLGTYSAY